MSTTPPRELRRRTGGPTYHMVVDVLRNAWWTRNWFLLVVLVLAVGAAVVAFVGQTVVPWAIYPAL